MCDEDTTREYDEPFADPADDPVLSNRRHQPTRRVVLSAMAALGAAPFLVSGGQAQASSGATLGGLAPVTAAMHVHGSWSEGTGSWEAQFAQAAALGIDLLYLSDHDFRAEAYNYMTSLAGITMVTSAQGGLRQKSTTVTGATVRLLAESSGSSPASVMTSVQAKPAAFNRLRTSIAGTTLSVAFPAARIDPGSTFEIRVQLSIHPAYGSRPAGQFEVHYQFGAATVSTYLTGGGLVAVFAMPTPAAGSTYTFDLAHDVQSQWPDMLSVDNAFYMLSLVASSPRAGSVVDVRATLGLGRSQNAPAAIIALHQSIVDTYGPRYPAMAVWPTVEISRLTPHVIPYGVPAFMPDQSLITPASMATYYPQMVASVHAQGGVVSWAHPFGYSGGPLLTQTQQDANRRAIFTSMMANGRYGTDLLEIGYAVRGQASLASHLALWDTFSRWAVFVTGTGVNDDHQGLQWSTLGNGFTTGLWAASTAQRDVVAALSAGRAYTFHPGSWPGGQLDMLVDGSVPMGKVSVSATGTRTLAVAAAKLPAGSLVEIVSGAVDFTGSDPLTRVVATLTASSLGPGGTAAVTVDTSASCFLRAQVRTSAGTVVGVGNPVWLLKAPPPGGIPAARLA